MNGQRSEALAALFAGDRERAESLLPGEDRLSVCEAAAFGRAERLRALLAADASQASERYEGFTPLHLAIFGGQAESCRILVAHGADVNARSSGEIARVPPLGTAAFVRSTELARLLLDAGADVDGQGEGGFTALHTAAANGDAELARLLLERGADTSIRTAAGKLPADLTRDDAMRSLLSES